MQTNTIVRASLAAMITAAILVTGGCASYRVGVVDGELSDCPSAPHCVSSQAEDPDKRVAPYRIAGDVDAAWRQAQAAVAAMPRTTVVDQKPDYLHAEVTSPWHVYTDDLELLLRPERRLIDVRSSSRIGYYDFNVNRDRITALRADLVARGVVTPAAPD